MFVRFVHLAIIMLLTCLKLSTALSLRRSTAAKSCGRRISGRPPSSTRLYSQQKTTGRARYNPSGKRKRQQQQQQQNVDTARLSHKKKFPAKQDFQENMKVPPLTSSHGPRPTYFSCRHTYEETLVEELKILLEVKKVQENPRISIAAPGLVRLEETMIMKESSATVDRLSNIDLVYALQVMPDCVVVRADSIKGLSQTIQGTLLGTTPDGTTNEADASPSTVDDRAIQLGKDLRNAPRSSLAIHSLVPGMFKGQKNPILERRSQKVAEELSKSMRKSYPAARKIRKEDEDDKAALVNAERWLLQVLLMSPEVAVASLVRCSAMGSLASEVAVYWPSWQLPAGLAKVDINDEKMPSSAYRKLMEALNCMGIRPDRRSKVFDLGACPGGWTWILRYLLDCSVVAVDRSELDPRLMKDARVDFRKGDAFSFEPSSRDAAYNVWMVSDVIAFPDRILELLSRWCGGHWADYMVVTMKFHGDKPDFPALQEAINLANDQGYGCRAKHFFNNKNEVTLMLCREGAADENPPRLLDPGTLGLPMYPPILPLQ